MGMAASQARYLALSARKTNIEYEGQQINQSRLLLSNQSADLFNQMLGMEVPTAPVYNDYTTMQYSFSDGNNVSVLSDFKQIGTPEADYNYIVTRYHYEDKYTGSRKLLNDPQIQATKTDHLSYDPKSSDNNKSVTVAKIWQPDANSYAVQAKDGSTKIFRAVNPTDSNDETQVKSINYGLGNGTAADETVDLSDTDVKAKFNPCVNGDIEAIRKSYTLGADATINPAEYYKNSDGVFVTKAEYTAAAAGTTGKKFTATWPDTSGTPVQQTWYTDGRTYIKRTDLELAKQKYDLGTKPITLNYITNTNNPEFSNYTAIGNSPLTQITAEDLKKDKIKTEIEQIIKDMQAQGGSTSAAENFAKCFDKDGNYLGGIYTFQMAGITYYTTDTDLQTSLKSAYEKNSIAENGIDGQQSKLAYYNATYLQTKVEEVKKALLETDGKGRFSTVKFEDDSVVYALNVESHTDEAAYNDAMNQYNYKKAQYDKTVNDINAKTKVLQAQDRELELRLEQLNTEQSALQNEMEAVKKVVDKHVEAGFKTFGG